MSLFDERALREIVADEVRRVLREELPERGRSVSDAEFLPVAEAASRVAVAPANAGNPNESTPEKDAELYLDRRRQEARKRV